MSHRWFRILAAIMACAPATLAPAQTFSNEQSISVIDFETTLYPSNISVSGITEPVGSISITWPVASFSEMRDIVAGVRGPDGTIYPLVSGCGFGALSRGTYTFVPRGRAPAFQPIPGTYVGTVCSASFSLFQVGGPVGDLDRLIGTTNVNGTWSLYVTDRFGNGSGGSVAGWSITFGPVESPTTPNSIAYQGRVASDSEPVDEPVTATFRLFDAPSGGSRVGATAVANVVPVDGLFTVPLDFGPTPSFDTDAPRWLEVAINGNTLLPRQPILPTPRALHARTADSATAAETAQSAAFATTATTATTANHAISADFATSAGSANTANSALSASTVPWAGVAAIPNNVANLRISPAVLANSSFLNGSLGLGAEPLASSRLHAVQPAVGATDWHIELTNSTIPAFRGGIRINNAGFLDISNNAGSAVGFFARLNSTGAWTVTSDARLKTDVRPAFGMLDTAMKLRPVYFHWLNDPTSDEDFGLIAQEVRDVLPRLVTGDESKDTLTVNYSQLSVVAIAAIQELKAKHEAEIAATNALVITRDHAQQEQIDALRAVNEDLLKRIERLESRQGE